MANFIQKKLNIYPHEVGRFVWIVAVFFVIFIATAVFRNYVDTTFLKRYGPQYIPWMLVINGGLTFVVFAISDRLARKFSDHVLLSGFLLLYAAAVTGLFMLVKMEVDLAYPLLYQLLYLLDTILLVYLWNICGDLFDARQGKRLFPLITAGQVLAVTLGNFGTEPLARLIGRDTTLLVFAGAFLAMALYLAPSAGKMLGDKVKKVAKAKAKAPRTKMTELPKIIKQYPIIRYLIILGLIPNILLPIFTYQFSVIANATFPTEQGLISFLGIFRGGMTMATFFLLFIVGRVYAKMGIANAALVHPINFALIFSGLSFFFNIYIAAAGQFTLRLVQRSVAGPVTKVLFSIIPGDLMTWSRTFVRGTVVKVGVLTGALLMIVLKPVMDAQSLSPIAVVLALYFVYETIVFGRRYKRGLKQVIIQQAVDFDQIETVRASDCNEGALALGKVVGVEDRTEDVLEEVVTCPVMPTRVALDQLDDTNPSARAEAAASFTNSHDLKGVRPLVTHLNDDEVVRKAAIESLIGYGEGILPYLESTLVGTPARVQRSILEVIRISGFREFEMLPFVGDKVYEAFGNLVALRVLTREEECVSVKMLKTHMEEKNDEILSLVFHALWVFYADMRLMYEALRSEDSSVAVEMVEATLDRELAPYLIPLIEGLPLEEKIDRGRKILPVMRNENLERILTILAHADDPTTRLLALFVIGECQLDPSFIPTLEASAEGDPSPDVRQAAEYALARCQNEDAPMPDIIETIKKLKSFSIFEGMGVRELQAISSVATAEVYPAGEVLIEEGEDNSSIFLITSGHVGVYSGYGSDSQVQKVVLGDGAFIGELSLFTKSMANASCVAEDEVETFVIRHHQFQEIMKIYPQIGINLCGFLATKLRETTY